MIFHYLCNRKNQPVLFIKNHEKNLFGMYLVSVDFAYRLMGKTN